MLGIPRELVKHALNVDPKAQPVKQPLRRFNKPKCKAIAAKLHRLKRWVHHGNQNIKLGIQPSNCPKEKYCVGRVCVDYIALNKHCPKDPFPLPRIDQIIDSTAGCARLSFLYSYSCYNHINLMWKTKKKQHSSHHTECTIIKLCPSV
jgi:hypothetical protein